MGNLASSYDMVGRHADALKLREETLALRQTKLGADHPSTLLSMNALGDSYSSLGRHNDALKLREQTLALRKTKFGADHPETLMCMNNLAASYSAVGRHSDALKVSEETLALRKAKLGPDHPDTLMSMLGVARNLVAVERSAAAIPVIDECLRLAAGKDVDTNLCAEAVDVRLRCFVKTKDVAGCRQTVAMADALKPTDGDGLYTVACLHAVYADMLRAADKSAAGAHQADAEADRAMAGLKEAVAAGFKNGAHMRKDKDLDSLRTREDFKQLIAKLE